MQEHSSMSAGRALLLGVVAAALHAAFDAATWPSHWLRAPHLRIEDAPEMFRSLSPTSVSVAASAVSGVIASLAIAAIEPTRGRRTGAIAGAVGGFWAFSALLTYGVWLEIPWPAALASVLCAVPRGLVIGWALSRLSPAPAAAPG